MRVVVPHAGPNRPHPITKAAIAECCDDAVQFVDVSGDDLAYWRLFDRLWQGGESFLIIEHDNEPNRGALQAAAGCSCLWGRSSYPYGVIRTSGLGFTRFSAELLDREPKLMRELKHCEGGAPGPQTWPWMDWSICLALEQRGYVPHDHLPVGHHHWQPGGTAVPMCCCGSLTEALCPRQRHHADDPACRCAELVRPLSHWELQMAETLRRVEVDRIARERQRLYR